MIFIMQHLEIDELDISFRRVFDNLYCKGISYKMYQIQAKTKTNYKILEKKNKLNNNKPFFI